MDFGDQTGKYPPNGCFPSFLDLRMLYNKKMRHRNTGDWCKKGAPGSTSMICTAAPHVTAHAGLRHIGATLGRTG